MRLGVGGGDDARLIARSPYVIYGRSPLASNAHRPNDVESRAERTFSPARLRSAAAQSDDRG